MGVSPWDDPWTLMFSLIRPRECRQLEAVQMELVAFLELTYYSTRKTQNRMIILYTINILTNDNEADDDIIR
jgi:hypothetical protein